MKTIALALVSFLGLLAHPQAGFAQPAKPGIERVYVLYCGDIALTDMGRFSPGYSGPGALSDTCYLIKHAQGWLLWDTGMPDAVASMPEGQKSNAGVWTVKKTLASQLAEIGVKPSDINYLALSHSHGDHVGNVKLFAQSTLLVQKAEYEWPSPLGVGRFKPEHPATKLEGDHDVFGDGSIVIVATPGHTPGHQSLLVRLPKTGPVLLTGDAVHFKDNWDNRRVPAQNTDKDKTLASLQRLADLMKQHNAQLWINHDKAQRDGQKMSPEFYE
jgi:glyoxylase-like metal-dependent hydrolase (beta-lactamase superfamily II)